MRILDGELILSPSDLTGFAACAHLNQLELRAIRGEIERPERHDPLLDVLSRRGLEHERARLAKQHAEAGGGRVVTISDHTETRADILARAAETEAAMRAGVDVIYQAVLVNGAWIGYADFLWKVARPSPHLGDWSYEVADAKLARSVKAAAVLQCCAYSDAIARIQGVEPEQLHVITGDGETHSFRLADYSAYYRRQKADLEATVLTGAAPALSASTITLDTYPDPVDHCSICRWSAVCATKRRADDHLSLVAGMTRSQTRRCTDVGITTRRALAAATVDDRPARIAEPTFAKLRHQAALQVEGEGQTPPIYHLLPVVWPGSPDGPDPDDPFADMRPKGLAALPAPSPGDVFLDLEGDPYVYVDGGLEYLFGVVTRDAATGEPRYDTFWAHDRAQEKTAFEQVIDFIVARRAAHPDMHVYHYAPYEPNAVRRLMGSHATREAEVDDLLRGEVFVDLYQVVRHALRLSTESYSLKQVEQLYMQRPPGEVMDAGGSIVAYERYLQDPSDDLLAEIAAYNRDDCVSIYELRDWFEARRAEVEARTGVTIPRPRAEGRDTVDLQAELDETDTLVDLLTRDLPTERGERSPDQQAQWLLAQLLHWHRREEKPKWWQYFDRIRPDKMVEDFVADRECIGGVIYEGVVEEVKQSLVHRFSFEPQDHKFDESDTLFDPATENRVGTVVEVGDDWLTCKRARNKDIPVPRNLIPGDFFTTPKQKAALAEIGMWVHTHGIDAPGPHRAARDLLLRRGPRLAAGPDRPLIGDCERPLDAACRLVTELDGGCLAIQGPPGSGKTYTGAHMVLTLLREGKRVGITAQSHAVIGNFLRAVLDEADELGADVLAVQKADDDDHCGLGEVAQAASNADVLDALMMGDARLAAGTSWLWCDPALWGSVDVLFVDEAGQRSLADVIASSMAATNLVLLGDPQQLAQVSHGSHPEGAEKSALAHLLDGQATMPGDLGLFLDTTFRMHPDVCAFVSDVVYEGKLHSEPGLERQLVDGDGLVAGAGLWYVPVEHAGNTTSSPEEAAVVAGLFEDALGRRWTDDEGRTRTLTVDDVLVVAPYNAQVAELRRRLPDGARVGTVDEFQGQEAPITIYSMASSTAEDAPRGMDFLYDLHRLNVAVSRARSISIVVCSPELQRVVCRTPEQMRLANAMCLAAADGSLFSRVAQQ